MLDVQWRLFQADPGAVVFDATLRRSRCARCDKVFDIMSTVVEVNGDIVHARCP